MDHFHDFNLILSVSLIGWLYYLAATNQLDTPLFLNLSNSELSYNPKG